MSVTTIVKPVLEPAAQAFADANANPPFLFQMLPAGAEVSCSGESK